MCRSFLKIVPDDVWQTLIVWCRELVDTDWHIHCLFDGLLDNATTERVRVRRYAINGNHSPDDAIIYPGQSIISSTIQRYPQSYPEITVNTALQPFMISYIPLLLVLLFWQKLVENQYWHHSIHSSFSAYGRNLHDFRQSDSYLSHNP